MKNEGHCLYLVGLGSLLVHHRGVTHIRLELPLLFLELRALDQLLPLLRLRLLLPFPKQKVLLRLPNRLLQLHDRVGIEQLLRDAATVSAGAGLASFWEFD